MARRNDHSQEEIKAMILNAAETLVAEGGYSELKVRSIAMEIGYTVGSIYMLFENLADLIMHLQARTLDDLSVQLQQLPTEDSPSHCLQNIAIAYFKFAQQHYHRWQMVFRQPIAKDETFPEWYKARFEQLYEPIEQQFRLMSIQCSSSDIRVSAQAFMGGIHGICSFLMPLHKENEYQHAEQTESILTLFVGNFVRGWLANTVA